MTPKSKPPDFELEADAIVAAAVAIFRESGLDAVSMRSVSSRLGVSPVPLYSRVGNKEALVEAIADRLMDGVAPEPEPDEPWTAYAPRWAAALRMRLRQARDTRLMLVPDRAAYVDAADPLIEVLRRDGFAGDAAVRACRLIMWATIGFGAVEAGARPPTRPRRSARPGGDPGGAGEADADALFDLQIRYLVEGLARDHAAEGS